MKKYLITFLLLFCTLTWAMANEEGREFMEGSQEGWEFTLAQRIDSELS